MVHISLQIETHGLQLVSNTLAQKQLSLAALMFGRKASFVVRTKLCVRVSLDSRAVSIERAKETAIILERGLLKSTGDH